MWGGGEIGSSTVHAGTEIKGREMADHIKQP